MCCNSLHDVRKCGFLALYHCMCCNLRSFWIYVEALLRWYLLGMHDSSYWNICNLLMELPSVVSLSHFHVLFNQNLLTLYLVRFVGVGARRVRSLFQAAKKKVFYPSLPLPELSSSISFYKLRALCAVLAYGKCSIVIPFSSPPQQTNWWSLICFISENWCTFVMTICLCE